MAEKLKFRLTADIGDLKRGAVIELTEEAASSALYASRVVPAESGSIGSATVDLEAIREQLRGELEEDLKEFIAEAQAEANKLIADAQAQAKAIVEAAQAEAMKLAAGGKR